MLGQAREREERALPTKSPVVLRMAAQLVALLTVLTILRVAAQPWPSPLRFRADGTFKIVEVICTIHRRRNFSALRSS